jgi:4a-hydroxytetrahydrobiopterin dehydratase
MSRPAKLDTATIDAWLSKNPPWQRVSDTAIAADFKFANFAAALAFAVEIGCAAEKADHHPDLEVRWGHVRVLWSTHDAGGITSLDLALAETTSRLRP